MGFFNFFKRDISEEEFQEQQKVKRGLEKTRTGFFQRIVNTLTNAQIDDDLYDQLEEQLILADVGPACAVRLVDELHDEVEEKHLKTGQEALDALRGIICQELTPRYPMDLDGKPAVILVIGVNGVGKTTTAMAFAKVLGLETRRVQFTSDTVPSDIIGFSVYDKKADEFVYKPGAIMTNLLLADEINRTSSKTQSALLEAMEEHKVTVDGKTYALPDPFIVLATQNPVGSAGTTMLPNSQLDRFLIRVSMGYPDHKSSVNILRDRHVDNPLDRAYAVVNKEELLGLVQDVRKVDMRDAVLDYVTTLVEKTRSHPQAALGVSPRGALAVCRMAKAYAYLNGRDFVMPEDVAAIFPDVCAHRLMLNSKARMMEEKPETVLAEILKTTDMPVLKK